MKKSMKCLALVLVLAVSLAMCVSCSSSSSSSSSNSNTKIKAKIILVLKDKTEVPYNITVNKGSTLRKALYQAKLIDKKTYGAMTSGIVSSFRFITYVAPSFFARSSLYWLKSLTTTFLAPENFVIAAAMQNTYLHLCYTLDSKLQYN